MSQKPFFIAIEGIDGAGKDTLAVLLRDHFVQKHELNVVLTEEPSQGSIGPLIRKMLDGEISAPDTNFVFQVLFIEDRGFHIRSCIGPELRLNRLVISVRYWLSTLAYGMLDGSVAEYIELHKRIIGSDLIIPDLTIVLDLDEDEALRRIQGAGRQFDWFAKKEKLERIRRNYLELAKNEIPILGNSIVVDAMKSKEQVALAAETAIKEHYLKKMFA